MDMVNLRSPPSMADANHGAGQGRCMIFYRSIAIKPCSGRSQVSATQLNSLMVFMASRSSCCKFPSVGDFPAVYGAHLG